MHFGSRSRNVAGHLQSGTQFCPCQSVAYFLRQDIQQVITLLLTKVSIAPLFLTVGFRQNIATPLSDKHSRELRTPDMSKLLKVL